MLYPVAETAEAALHAARGHAAREREAETLAHGAVAFVPEATGPGFATREAALDAYAGLLDDERPGRIASVPPERRWCALQPVAAPGKGGRTRIVAPVAPIYRDGRRWPVAPPPETRSTLWRLSVSYWKVAGGTAEAAHPPARKLRRDAKARELQAEAVKALSEQPMRPHQPQQALDIGLFERRLPENPSIIVPDE